MLEGGRFRLRHLNCKLQQLAKMQRARRILNVDGLSAKRDVDKGFLIHEWETQSIAWRRQPLRLSCGLSQMSCRIWIWVRLAWSKYAQAIAVSDYHHILSSVSLEIQSLMRLPEVAQSLSMTTEFLDHDLHSHTVVQEANNLVHTDNNDATFLSQREIIFAFRCSVEPVKRGYRPSLLSVG